MTDFIDFRSDTVTQPTPQMRLAMANADVGDDILREDSTVIRLEAVSAELLGKEAGLFVLSGTMGNQVALQTLTQRGDEVLMGMESHIFNLEVGGLAALSGIQTRVLNSYAGRFDPHDVRSAVRPKGLQSPITKVLCLENTYDLNRGIPLPVEYFAEMSQTAREFGITVYLDGARIFNASAFFGVDVATLCRDADVVMFCLTKGLAAPFGSLLVGSSEFIDHARWIRQRLGGGMRQAGHMAAAALVALNTMRERLNEDNILASRLRNGLAAIDPRIVDIDQPLTNIVRIDLAPVGKSAVYLMNGLLQHGIKIKPIGETSCRMVTHWGITEKDVDKAIGAVASLLQI